jgi:hypothetical protein
MHDTRDYMKNVQGWQSKKRSDHAFRPNEESVGGQDFFKNVPASVRSNSPRKYTQAETIMG